MFIIDICWSRHFLKMKSRCVHHFPLAILFFHFFNHTRWRDLHHDEVFWVLVIFFIILLQEWRVHLEDPVFTIDLKTIFVHLPWACSVLKCQSLTIFAAIYSISLGSWIDFFWFLIDFFIDFCCYLQYFVGVMAIFVREWRAQSQFLLLFTLL